MKKRMTIMAAIMIMLVGLFTACGTDDKEKKEEEKTGGDSGKEEISGDITVLTNRTDIVDTTFKEYAKKFNEKYPDVNVEFEAITDYEGQVKIRMNSTDYGDVLLIPNDVPVKDLANFFEPLGKLDEMSDKYRFVDEKAFEGQTYGIPVFANAEGVVYNKQVFADAGIEELPKTPEEFLGAMQKIKEKTKATPVYTNYAAGWPLTTSWENNRIAVAGEANYVNEQMVEMDDPFAEGKPHYIIYKLMYDLANQELIESDPLTTDWETSKQMLADGEIGAMVLGSWVVSQIQALTETPENIGYMPFPYNVDGKMYAASGGDYKMGINKNSENKEAARAWLDWFMEESNFALEQGGISPLKDAEMPETLASFEEMEVELISSSPAKEGQEGWVDQIDQQGEVGLYNPDFKQRIIEAAIGNRDETFLDITDDLNEKWKRGREAVVAE